MEQNTSSDDNAVGQVQVKVSPKAIHNAVRNVLVNEMGMSSERINGTIASLVKETSEKTIEEKTLSYLRNNHYDGAQLFERIKRAMQEQINDLKPIIKEVARELVHETIEKDVEGVISGIVRDGLKVRLGWNRDIRVNVESADHSKLNWIPIAERAAPEGKLVLVVHGNSFNSGRDVSPATYRGEEFHKPEGGTLIKVTHWRNLPDLPKVGR